MSLSGAGAIDDESTAGVDAINLPLTLTASGSAIVGQGAGRLDLGGVITAAQGVTLAKSGPGTLGLLADSGATFRGTTSVAAGALVVDGVIGPVSLDGGTLGGTGRVGAITAGVAGGTVAPGHSPGVLHTGSIAFNGQTTYAVELAGSGAGQFDQLDVTGSVSLGGATLTVDQTFTPGATDQFIIINNDGTDVVSGTFAGLPQGSTIIGPDGTELVVNYRGGDGNDVVLQVNAPPIANNDFYALPGNSVLVVPTASGLLANDNDPNATDTLQATIVTSPQHGSLSANGDGSFTYTPTAGYSGPDSFTYTASDGRLTSNTATVSLAINPAAQPPQAAPDSYSSPQDTLLTVGVKGVLANDYSPQGDALTAQIVANASKGTVSLNADGSFTYAPQAGFVGSDSFSYRARDAHGLSSNVTTAVINVGVLNVAPVGNADTYQATEDKVLFVIGPGVLANDTDANGDSLSSVLVNAPLHGSLTLGGDGSINYTPDPNFNGTDTFTYRALDGGKLASSPTLVTINVAAVPDAPVGVADSYVTPEDTTLAVPAGATQGVLFNDIDVDGNAPTAVLVDGPAHALAFTFNADGTFSYTPAANYNGADSFTYRPVDPVSGLQGATTTVSIAITPVNDAPTAFPDGFTTNQETTLAVAGPGVLANDKDVEGDLLSAVLLTGAQHGTLSLPGDGSINYTPAVGFSGTDTFTV